MLLPGAASARAQYYCRMTGRVIAATTCDNRSAPKVTLRAEEVQLPDCCQRLSSSNRSASLGTPDAINHVAPAAHVATLTPAFGLGPSSGPSCVCAEPTQAPLAIGPPLFIVHCAFLS
jgi:hypothetical protein